MPEAAPTASTAEVDLAREALLEVTPASTVGEAVGSIVGEDGVVTVHFATALGGYPGWRWTVSLARVEGGPSVLETELTPGEGALLSPDWVPWADRLAEYKEAKAAGLEGGDDSEAGLGDDDSDDSDDDDDDDDTDDVDDDLLHAGDLDGVDIDEDYIEGAEVTTAGEPEGRSAPAAVGDDEAQDAEGESGDAAPEPPVQPRRRQRSKKQQKDGEGDQPQD